MDKEIRLSDSEAVFSAVIESGGVFTLRPRGDSMRPTILPGRDSVSIIRLDGEPLPEDILFYKRPDGQFVLHRLIGRDKGGYILCGDYQTDPERGVSRDWVIGVVSIIHRPDGDLVRGTPAFSRAGRRRRQNRPLRVLYSGLRRLFGKK